MDTNIAAARTNGLYFPMDLTDPGPHNSLVYEYHMYQPFEFTHQNASWVPSMVGTTAKYPDPDRVIALEKKWVGYSQNNPAIASGTNDWTMLTGNLYQVTDTRFQMGHIVAKVQNLGVNGTVYIDDITAEEYDGSGQFVRTLKVLSVDDFANWSLWAANGIGTSGIAEDIVGSSNNRCIMTTGTTDNATLSYDYWFEVRENYQYKVTGRMKTVNVSNNAILNFQFDFYETDGPIHSWNKEYLTTEILKFKTWSTDNNVPLYLGEFGTIHDSFQDNRGGLTWVEDMLNILTTNDVNYNYHTYHEHLFGIYTNPANELPDPDEVNQPLIDLFKQIQ